MTKKEFSRYLATFEEEVVYAGIVKDKLGVKELVSVRNGKLARTNFGRSIGCVLPWEVPAALDYYGHFKKSLGFLSHAAEQAEYYRGKQVHLLRTTVVHFASIRIEQVAQISNNSFLTAGFPDFKRAILVRRGYT